MSVLFFSGLLFCVYTYALYPLWLEWRVRWQRRTAGPRLPAGPDTERDRWPDVSIVIAAHNEHVHLPAKVASLDALDYPAGQLQVVFVSDGSTDDTVAWLSEQCAQRAGWQVIHYHPACGKPTALNAGVRACHGEVLVFMDARQRVANDALKPLVAGLSDTAVGVVSGELELEAHVIDEAIDGDTNGITDGAPDGASVGLYWRYEKWIRNNESKLGSTTGATGALFAMRRAQYTELAADTLLDDFDTPVRLLRQGLVTRFEPAARVFDRVSDDSSQEFRRKTRTLAGNVQSFRRHRWLFNPRRNPVWWQFLSHKVFRLLVPYALFMVLVASVFGEVYWLRLMLVPQLLFYGLGLAAQLGWSNNRLAWFIRTFVQLNAAAVLGAWRNLTGSADVLWKRAS